MHVLITGANSGIGYGIAENLISSYSPSNRDNDTLKKDKLTLFLACRNEKRAQEAKQKLEFDFADALDRVTIKILLVDLSNVESVVDACLQLRKQLVLICSSRENSVKLDIVYLNAGVLPVESVNYCAGAKFFLSNPRLFFSDVSCILVQKKGERTIDGHLGQVFAANVFGHYVMVRKLFDILSKDARIIWTGSMTSESSLKHFSFADFQGLKVDYPYECSKIATNLLTIGLNEKFKSERSNIRVYIADPGVVSTNILSDGMHFLLKYFVMMPFIYLASFFFHFITYNIRNASISHLYLSGVGNSVDCFSLLKDQKQGKQVETISIIKNETPEPNMKYQSCYNRLTGNRYVMQKDLFESAPNGKDFVDISIENGNHLLHLVEGLYQQFLKEN